jgi:hypothetical protein
MREEPYLDAGLRGWIFNTARTNHWRLQPWYELEDLIQDGYLAYSKCWHRYKKLFDVPEPTKDQRRHFASLVQISYLRHLHTLSVQHPVNSEVATDEGELVTCAGPAAPVQEDVALLLATLRKLPEELVDVLEKLMDDASYLRLPRLYWQGNRLRRQRGHIRWVRETTEEHWERILGQAGMPEKLIAYLRS